jgi:hypothetical protein
VNQSTVWKARKIAYTNAKDRPLPSAAPAVNTASRTRMPIWTKARLRVRPSLRPCSSRYSDPLFQAIQIRAKTTANSASPRTETCSAR